MFQVTGFAGRIAVVGALTVPGVESIRPRDPEAASAAMHRDLENVERA